MQAGSSDLGAPALAPAFCCALATQATAARFFGRTTPRTLMKFPSRSLPAGSRSFALQRAGEGFVLGELFQPSNGFSRPTERAPIHALCPQPNQSWPNELLGENKNLIENASRQTFERAQPGLSPTTFFVAASTSCGHFHDPGPRQKT